MGRPDFGNRPGVGGRPGIDGGHNRPSIGGNRPGLGDNNNIHIGDNNININRPGWGIGPGNFNRPGGNWNNHWNNHWNNNCINNYHHGWYHGCWNGGWNNHWYVPLAYGATAWGLGAWTSSWGYGAGYVNPYYQPAETGYNYSQPVVVNNYVSSDATGGAAQSTADAQNTEALKGFDGALESFKAGTYVSALMECDRALQELPNDPVIHEVRALCLYALGKYQPAAATLNSLLATAPGMDWTTLSGLYGDPEDYTKQLRALESFVRANPKDAAAQFVVAYHYLVLGDTEAAGNALKVVVAQQPKDATAQRMLDAITRAAQADEPPPMPKPPTPGETPADSPAETDLVGVWLATAGKTTVELSIDERSQFVWKATTTGGKPMEISGTVEAGGNSLELTSADENQGTMSGDVKSGGADKFTFRLAGSPTSDPGLDFSRQTAK